MSKVRFCRAKCLNQMGFMQENKGIFSAFILCCKQMEQRANLGIDTSQFAQLEYLISSPEKHLEDLIVLILDPFFSSRHLPLLHWLLLHHCITTSCIYCSIFAPVGMRTQAAWEPHSHTAPALLISNCEVIHHCNSPHMVLL